MALEDAAASIPEAASALPPPLPLLESNDDGSGGGSDGSDAQPLLGSYLLGPKQGQWVLWGAALGSIVATWEGGERVCMLPGHEELGAGGGGGGDGGKGGDDNDTNNPGDALASPREYYAYSGGTALFVPSAASCCLQYVYCLSLRAGMHPVLVGGGGCGKRSLVRHALSCVRVFGQLAVEVVGGTQGGGVLSATSALPGQLQELLTMHLTQVGGGTMPGRGGGGEGGREGGGRC